MYEIKCDDNNESTFQTYEKTKDKVICGSNHVNLFPGIHNGRNFPLSMNISMRTATNVQINVFRTIQQIIMMNGNSIDLEILLLNS